MTDTRTKAQLVALVAELEAKERSTYEVLQEARRKLETLDYSLREPVDGRYDGDYYARLTRRPIAEKGDHPYLVEVWEWREFSDRGHDAGYEDGWRSVSPVLHNFPTKSFARLDKAITYLQKVLNSADAAMIRRRAERKLDEVKVNLA